VNGPLPLGLTVKVAPLPAFNVCVVAAVVTVGGWITVNTASLEMLPYGVVAVTRYVPLSVATVDAKLNVAVWFAKATSTSLALTFVHW
jgi:hypothetical protein